MMLIAMTGPAGCGKNAAAKILVDNYSFVEMSLAEPMKNGLMTMMGWGPEMINGELKETSIEGIGKSPRELMQTLATEWGRNTVHPDIWLQGVIKQWEFYKGVIAEGKVKGVVITDLRFDNEADWVRSEGGHVVHIDRLGTHEPIEASGHSSESGVDVYKDDYTIRNNHVLGLGNLVTLVTGLMELIRRDETHGRTCGGGGPGSPGDALVIHAPKHPHSISALQDEIAKWADGVFPQRTAHNAITKLMLEEIPELMMSKSMDPMEFADVVILVLDIAHLQGIDVEKAVLEKMAINRDRKWFINPHTNLMSHHDWELIAP